MEPSLEKDKPVVRLRAFRAIDDLETCEKFLEGHALVLTNIGITKVTSSKNEWISNPGVFVIVVESLDGEKIFGGARVHVSFGEYQLPIEEATSLLDPSIHDLVWRYSKEGTGEICGLWNSQELAGYGIGSPLLIRTGIAISSQIGLSSLFALCAPYTVKPVVNCGMVLEDSIGNKGTFYYPKLDLLATTMILKNVQTLSMALEEDKTAIFSMRSNPNNLTINELKGKDITVHFALKIPKLELWDIFSLISETMRKPLTVIKESDIDFF